MQVRAAIPLGWVCVLALAACGGASEGEGRSGGADASHAAGGREEAPWDEQVRAVEAGESAEIRIETATITDADLDQLDGLAGLKRLNLGRAERISEAGLTRIASVPGLALLRLDGAALDDAALTPLREMHALRYLMLYDVPITDDGLRHLHGLDGLESFYFSGTGITDAGIRALTDALPDLHVHW